MPTYSPDFESFQKLARDHDIVPIFRQLLADRITPVTAFEVLGRDEHAFLLESVVGGDRVGRHSFIATRPKAVYQCREGHAVLWRQGKPLEEFKTTDPLEDLSKLLGKRRYAQHAKLPAFTGGLVGYAAYDLARYYEPEKLQTAPPDDRGLPQVSFGLYDDLVIFDHVDKTVRVVANVSIDHAKVVSNESLKSAYENACRRVDLVVQRLNQPSNLSLSEIDTDSESTITPTQNLTREQFENGVRNGLEYIRAGDVFQYVPSIRLRLQSDVQPLDVYRTLRVINPSPFMFFLKSPQCILIGSSPEILCRVKDGIVTTRPLAGTRRRGATDEEDRALGPSGVVVPIAEPQQLADAALQLLGDAARWQAASRAAIARVERYYTDRLMFDRYRQVYERALARTPGAA